MNSGNSFQANTIDRVSGETDISNFWKDHFYKLLNTNDCDTNLKFSIMNKLDNVQYSNDMIISIKLIQEAVGNLECGKSAGPDGIFGLNVMRCDLAYSSHIEIIPFKHCKEGSSKAM